MNRALLEEARAFAQDLRDWRRHLHANPELSGHEEASAGFVAAKLKEFGLKPVERVAGKFGLYADMRVNDRQEFFGLRADMDALPIHEETGVEYVSRKPGVMHACGHDAHMTMLLGAVKLLTARRDQLRQNTRFIFQPHEELFPGGAPDMIAGGALNGVKNIFGIHISSNLPTGEIGSRVGPFMAAVNPLHIRVTGRGGHAAMPNECVDPIVAASQIVLALQTIVSRNMPVGEPAVVSITQFHAGTADNIIPNEVMMHGTVRSFNNAIRDQVCRRVGEIAEAVARAHGATVKVEMDPGYPVLVNDPNVLERVFTAARSLGFDGAKLVNLPPQGGGEDFAYYCEKIPGAFVFLGARNDAKQCVYPHHHPKFNIDEDALASGAALHAQMALSAEGSR